MPKKYTSKQKRIKKPIHREPQYKSETVTIHEGYRGQSRIVPLKTLERKAESIHVYNSSPESIEEIKKLLRVYSSREVYIQLNPDKNFYHGVLVNHDTEFRIEDLFESATVINLWSIDLENLTKLIVIKNGKRFYT